MALFRKKDEKKSADVPLDARFKILKTALDEMYADDRTLLRNVQKDRIDSSQLSGLTVDSLLSQYYGLTTDLSNQRKYSNEAYVFYPVYAAIVDYLSNMYLWRYTYVPRMTKESTGSKADYKAIYQLMGEVVDGLSIETVFPLVLSQLFIDGAVYLLVYKSNRSKTLTTLTLPTKYCRISSQSQFGVLIYQFDFSYFDNLGLNSEELKVIFEFFPPEMKTMYERYLTDKTNLRWQVLDPKYAGAIACNKYGFPTQLRALVSLLQYDTYLNNEVERSNQQLDKIISHQMPTWEDKLIVDINEMRDLHTSIAKVLKKNKHVNLVTTFGEMDVLSIGQDETKENKTLTNAYNAIYNTSGHNPYLFSSEDAVETSLTRDETIVWKYVQQLMSLYNLVVNNNYTFKGYQCDITMLPITAYNENDKILLYKEGATLGVSKLEYIVSTGIKQVDLNSKIELENFLKLDQLKPLSTSYTQNDNSKQDSTEQNKVEQEVDNSEENTK